MDAAAAPPDELRRSLAYIRRVNSFLGYHRSTISHLSRFSRNWKPGETIRLLDVATGSGDLPRAVLRWSRQRGLDVRVVGVDLHGTTLAQAKALTPGGLAPRLTFARADALRLPFADGAFDYATSAMFLHHLDDESAVLAMREMARVGRRGIVVADLLRHRRAYGWIALFTALSRDMVKHDGRTSVMQAFTTDEVLRLRERAGVGFAQYFRHFGHRFVLAGER